MSSLFLFPIRQIRNNAVQSGLHVNVAKELTTADDGGFAGDRAKYVAISNINARTLSDDLVEKKWTNSCANRDSSGVVERRRVRALGQSLNPEGGQMCNVSKIEQNSRANALTRVRAGGANVPQKVRHRLTSDGVPMSTKAPTTEGGLLRTANRLPWLEHPNQRIV